MTFFASSFFTSGVIIGLAGVELGEPVGAGVAGTGVVVETGAGVEGGLFGESVFVSQALKTAVETARTVVKIIDLLIVFLLYAARRDALTSCGLLQKTAELHGPVAVRWQTTQPE